MNINIFISYSHSQQEYFKIFNKDFKNYITPPNLPIEVFSDDGIPIGTKWDEYLQNKVINCDIIILLVSQELMNSPYIQEKEFGIAIERLKSGNKILIVPIYFSPCQFTSDHELSQLQFFKPNGNDYSSAHKGDKFSYIDLVTFRQTDGLVIPNADRQHYMMELARKLQPEIQKFLDKL
jgi:hypothetical protein